MVAQLFGGDSETTSESKTTTLASSTAAVGDALKLIFMGHSRGGAVNRMISKTHKTITFDNANHGVTSVEFDFNNKIIKFHKHDRSVVEREISIKIIEFASATGPLQEGRKAKFTEFRSNVDGVLSITTMEPANLKDRWLEGQGA